MAFLHNITTVAHYEAKTLRRSWFFRLFATGSLVIFTFMNIGLFSPIGDESWDMISIPSALPFVNLYLLNIGQAIIVIFLAADFLKRDKKLDTNEVLYTRPMSNFEYVTGKTLGILRLFLSQNLLILSIGLVMNIISKRMSIDILSYFEYLLILSVPTIIFSLGLAFMLMSVIRNQAVTFLVLLGYAALNMFWLWYRAGSIFDYMAFGVPAFKSGMIGFDNPEFLINQRLIYLFLGLALVFGTILIFKRLPQSKLQSAISAVLMVVFFAGFAITLHNTWSIHKGSINNKQAVVETNRKFENKLFPGTITASLEVIHKGNSIDVNATLKFINDNKEDLENYLFSLNPSMKVSSVTKGRDAMVFETNGHIIDIKPSLPLKPGNSDSLTISYSGTIDESFCYPNYTDNINDYPYRIAMLNVNKRQAFLGKDYVLLTPETHWYPVSGLNYYPSNPARIKVDYTFYSLKARSENGLVAVSQGRMTKNNGFFTYDPDLPLTGLTLAMGNFVRDSIKIDSVEYYSWYHKGNDYYKKDLSELKDTLSFLVSGIMRELETNFSTKYPFKTLSIVEAPVQFYSYPKKNTQTRAELQPAMVIVPERLSTIEQAGFGKRLTRQKRQALRNNQVITDKELQVRIFNNFIRNTFISGENFRFRNGVAMNEPVRYRLGPSFYFFRNNFYSSEYPVINAAFESHLQKVSAPGRQAGPFEGMFGTISENDKANLLLKNLSFRELMEKNPGEDTIRTILTVKGDYFFNLLRKYAGIEEFKTWFLGYLDTHKFQRVDILELNKDYKEKFGFEFYPYLHNWFDGKDQPGFLFPSYEAREIVVGDRSRYLVTFVAANPEPVGGLFNIGFRTGGQGGGIVDQRITMNMGGPGGTTMSMSVQGRGMEAADITKIIYLESGEAKKISMILDNVPRAMIINTLFSRNLPGEITLPFDDIIKSRERIQLTESEERLPSLPLYSEPNELIVDNEDSGFVNLRLSEINPLKKILGIKRERGEVYGVINLFNPPDFWQPVIQTSYYGMYVRSAVYSRKGTGDKLVTWQGIITKPGYYDIYTFIGKAGDRITFRTGAGGPGTPGGAPGGPGTPSPDQNRDNTIQDLHFRVFHDEGVEEITVDYQNAEIGWNKLGTYYLSPDTVKVSLTNQTQGRIVIGDAVKWVMQK